MLTQPPKLSFRPSTDRPTVLDVRARSEDVRRIARAQGLFFKCVKSGWDEDDLDQEIFCRVLERQEMPSRYDPKRSGVGRYLHLLTSSIMKNLLDKARVEAKSRAMDPGDLERMMGGEGRATMGHSRWTRTDNGD
jgi:hypothetical protein